MIGLLGVVFSFVFCILVLKNFIIKFYNWKNYIEKIYMYLKIDNYKYLLRIYVDILKYMEGRGKRILINVFFLKKK